MQCKINNQTPFPARLEQYYDLSGKEHVLVVAKSTWHLDTSRLLAAEKQLGLNLYPQQKRLSELDLDDAQLSVLADRKDGEIVWLDHDLSPPKHAFDVLVAGYVTAPRGYAEASIEAGIRIGNRIASLVAHVPRYWDTGLVGPRARSLSVSVRRVPLTYAVADWQMGFPLEAGLDVPQRLPWLEAKGETHSRTRYAKSPASFGFWPENAAHRLPFCGTFDEAWRRTRQPALPLDFDARFYNVAHPDLQLPGAPAPGTPIRLVHLAETPVIDTRMPSLSLAVQATTRSGALCPATLLKPDTLTIEPDQSRFSLIWRALLPTEQMFVPSSIRLFKVETQFS